MATFDFDKVTSREGTNSVQFEGTQGLFKRAGLDPFWVADMDFETSDAVHKKITERLDNRIFGYTMTTDSNFFNPIINWWDKRFSITLDRKWLAIAPTVMFIVSEFIRRNTSEGDPVLITTPSYNGFLKTIENNNRVILECPLQLDGSQYTLDLDEFEELCKKENVKVYIHCNPHNPTGKIWSHEENQRIYAICKKHNVLMVSDEIHMDFVRNTPFDSMVNHLTENDQCLVVSGLGKTFNLASLPLAYYITKDSSLLSELDQKIHKELCLLTGNSLTLAAVEGAYLNGHDWVDALNKYIEENMKLVESYIREHLDEDLEFHRPDATYLCWINFDKSGLDPSTVHQAFIDVGNVALVPGKEYGERWNNHFRFNVASRRDRVKKGLESIRKTFDHLKNDI